MNGRLLLVEDRGVQWARRLEESGYEVETAADVAAALHRLRLHAFDGVLAEAADSGFELCRRVKGDAGLARVTVVLWVGPGDAGDVLRGLEAGADGFLTRGQPPAEILGRLECSLAHGPWARCEGLPVTVQFLGKRFAIAAERDHLLEILVSTFEDRAHVADRETEPTSDAADAHSLARRSHDIRTPVTGILGMLELAQDTDLTVEQRELLELARASAEQLLSLLSDTVGVSAIEAGRLTMEAEAPGLRDRVAGGGGEPAPVALRVLLAEDNAVNRALVTRILEKAGHHVVLAGTGREALEALEREHCDAVLMDVQMPDVDGLEATARIRQRERDSGGHLPVIAVTAHAMPGDRERCLAAGMDAYLAKPIRAREVLDALHAFAAPAGPPADEAAVVDLAQALERVEGDWELLGTLATLFLERAGPGMQRLRDALGRGDAHLVERTAHSMRGSAAIFSARPLVEAAEQLERMGRDGELAAAPEALRGLQRELDRLAPVLVELVERVAG